MPPRQRLTPDGRRAQLLAVGARLFAAHPYADVLMEEVADEAGISRALLYRHFPSKQALFAAVYQQAADQLLADTRLDPARSLREQLLQGMDVHLDYFVANRNAVLAANRVLAGDPVIQTIMANELDVLRERLLGVLPLAGDDAREAVSGVLKAWLVFVQVLCVDWLTRETCTRDQLRDICVGAALGALGPLLSPPSECRSGRELGVAVGDADQREGEPCQRGLHDGPRDSRSSPEASRTHCDASTDFMTPGLSSAVVSTDPS